MYNKVGPNLNIKNPACYVFPKENNCEIGEHFKYTEISDANLFLERKPYNFNMPKAQIIANRLSIFALCSFIIMIVFILVFKFRK